jgi:hypothetical protein
MLAQVMDAWHGVAAAPDPLESGAERRERVMHHAIAQGCPLIGHQERRDPLITDATTAGVHVSLQGRHGGGMERHDARFPKLRVAHREQRAREVHVRGRERERFGNPQPGAREQSEQRGVRAGAQPQARDRPELRCGID